MLKLANLGILLVLMSLSFVVTSASGPKDVEPSVEGSAKADKLDVCVAPTPFMRRNHFELIKHQRDITVHQGIRLTDDSLAGCIDCHAGKDTHGHFVPVNAKGEFCAGCHEYTGVTFDCFTCHAAKPTKTGS